MDLKTLDKVIGEVTDKRDELWYKLRKALVETGLALLDNDKNKVAKFKEDYLASDDKIKGFMVDEDGDDLFIISEGWMENLDFYNLDEMRDFGSMMIDGEFEIEEINK